MAQDKFIRNVQRTCVETVKTKYVWMFMRRATRLWYVYKI
jgi:hypothetical protein